MQQKILALGALLSLAPLASAVVFHYDGDTVPSAGTYGTWFTTIGAGTFGTFPSTSWSSNGSVLTMNTAPGAGLWFGRIPGTADGTASLAFSNALAGNFIEARVALSPTATDWTFYFYDASAKGGMFTFSNNVLKYWLATTPGGTAVANEVALDMTSFRTLSAYLYNSETFYFVDGVYIGGGFALTGSINYLLIGDDSGSTPTGTGSMSIDYLTLTTDVGETSPLPIPEPATYAGIAGALALGGALLRRRTVSQR